MRGRFGGGVLSVGGALRETLGELGMTAKNRQRLGREGR